MTAKASRAQRLLDAAREAAELRAYRTHPDVAALAIERTRARVDALVWTGLVLGLGFTMSNVAAFAGAGTSAWTIRWVIAWLLDPMVSLCLIGVLLGEATLARYQLRAGSWARSAKWGLLAATYTMNTWTAWAGLDPALIVLHSVPPAVVFAMAEAITDLRDRLTDAVTTAHRYATHRTDPVGVSARSSLPGSEMVPTASQGTAAAVSARSDSYRSETARHTNRTRTARSSNLTTSGPDVSDLLGPGRAVADRLAAAGEALSRRALIAGLRADGHQVSTNRASALLRHLTTDTASEPVQDTAQAASEAESAAEAATRAA